MAANCAVQSSRYDGERSTAPRGARPEAGFVLSVSAYGVDMQGQSKYAVYTLSSPMPKPAATKRRGLSRQAIVQRAIGIGNAEGLDAVSLRRLAADFGVTPMALYRHVKDKQDLVNAMTEVVLDGMDLKAGFRPSMSWSDRARRAM